MSFINVAIIVLGVIAGYIGTFHNQKMIHSEIKQQFNLVPKNFQAVRFYLWRKMHTKEWWGYVLCSIAALALVLFKGQIDRGVEKHKDDEHREELKEQREYFGGLLRAMQKDAASERKETKQQNDYDLKEITGNMAKMYGEGRRKDSIEFEKTRKDVKLTPPNIEFVGKPDIPLNLELRNDSIIGRFQIENAGQLTAFDVQCDLYLIYMLRDQTVLRFKNPTTQMPPTTISGNPHGYIGFIGKKFQPNLYKSVSNFYCILVGKYYLDDDDKKVKKIAIGVRFDNDEKTWYSYNLLITPDSLLKYAAIIGNDY